MNILIVYFHLEIICRDEINSDNQIQQKYLTEFSNFLYCQCLFLNAIIDIMLKYFTQCTRFNFKKYQEHAMAYFSKKYFYNFDKSCIIKHVNQPKFREDDEKQVSNYYEDYFSLTLRFNNLNILESGWFMHLPSKRMNERRFFYLTSQLYP